MNNRLIYFKKLNIYFTSELLSTGILIALYFNSIISLFNIFFDDYNSLLKAYFHLIPHFYFTYLKIIMMLYSYHYYFINFQEPKYFLILPKPFLLTRLFCLSLLHIPIFSNHKILHVCRGYNAKT